MKTASSIRAELMQRKLTYHLLASDTRYREETIARHYLSLVKLAQQLDYLIQARERQIANDDTDSAIAYLVGTIKEAHLKDFGIELEWTKEKHESNTDSNANSR